MLPQSLEAEVARQVDNLIRDGLEPLQQRRIGTAVIQNVDICPASLLQRSDEQLER